VSRARIEFALPLFRRKLDTPLNLVSGIFTLLALLIRETRNKDTKKEKTPKGEDPSKK
jgi:hypothetical protein